MKRRKSFSFLLCLILVFSLFTALAVSASALNLTVGQNAGGQLLYQVAGGELLAFEALDTMPPGLSFSYGLDGAYLQGTPTQAGTWSVQFYTEEETDHMYQSGTNITFVVAEAPKQEVTPSPAPAAPVVSHHPTDVEVKEGESASFTSNATGFSWCAWRFVSPDGKEEVIFDKVDSKFPGLKVTGGNSTTMEISKVPMELNGWKAVLLFSSDKNVWTYSNGAKITVISETTPSPSPSSSPTVSPSPTATEAPTPTEAPTAAPTEAPTPEPTPEPAAQNNNTTLFVILGVFAVVVICGTVIIVSKNKHR